LPDADWAGFGNNTQVYCYLVVAGLNVTSKLTTTAPTYNDEKQGYYDATNTYRYYAKIYKDNGGNYSQKAIYMNQEALYTNTGLDLGSTGDTDRSIRFTSKHKIYVDESANEVVITRDTGDADIGLRFASDAAVTWDESENEYVITKDGGNADVGIRFASDAAITWDESDSKFHINKPLVVKHLKVVPVDLDAIITENALYDALSTVLSNVNDRILLSGGGRLSTDNNSDSGFVIFSDAIRASTNINLYTFNITTNQSVTYVARNGDTTPMFEAGWLSYIGSTD
jgi:hypothetical protein